MSEQSPESVSPAELTELLEGKPLLLRNLGFVANNAGLFGLYNDMIANDLDFIQIKRAIETELRNQGIAGDAADLLTLFDIPMDEDDV